MITPMIRELRKTFMDSFIATLTTPNTEDILLNNPNLNLTLTDDLRKETFWETVRKLRKENFTHGLLVMPTERAAYMMFLAGIRNRTGVGKKLYEVITMMKGVSRNKYIPLRHEADYSMDLARSIGVKSNELIPEIFLTHTEKETGMTTLENLGVSKDDYKIIVHTGSGNSSRNWSEEKYLELIKELARKSGNSKIILTAKEMSPEFIDEIRKLDFKNVIFVHDKLTRLRELIGIIANCNLLIASSTGPLHIASALRIKTIGLFCHRRMNCAKHWGALGNKAVNLEVSKEYCDLHCSRDKEVCEFENGISIQDVIDEI